MGDSDSSSDMTTTIHWTDKLEQYFVATGEKAHCLAWMHKRCEAMYSRLRTYIDLPVIVLSSVTGFCSVGSTTLFAGEERTASIVLGIISLFVGVLNTTGSYYGWAKRAEGHRISAIHYSKLFRYISVELALPREERHAPREFLKNVKDQYDRLQEISPLIPETIIGTFQTKFAHYDNIAKPEEANGLEKITVYREGEAFPVSIKPSSTPKQTNPLYRIAQSIAKSRRNSQATPTAPKEEVAIVIPSS